MIDSALSSLDYRWPNTRVITAYRVAFESLSLALRSKSSSDWPGLLIRYLQCWLTEQLSQQANCQWEGAKPLFREACALGGMLMHLRIAAKTRRTPTLINGRRTRTIYGTYPTSPLVGRAAAFYVLGKLATRSDDLDGQMRIYDPTAEGGSLLLEAALLLPNFQSRKKSNFGPSFILSATDRSSASVAVVRNLLSALLSCASAPYFQVDVKCQDVFDALNDGGAIDAIVNNPPWGAATDGSTSELVSPHGPYVCYRDPYIAITSLSIRRLNAGSPFAFILPFQLLTAASAAGLREELLENTQLDHLVQLPRKVFPRATVKTVLLLGCKRRSGECRRSTHVTLYPLERRLSERSLPTAKEFSGKIIKSLGSAPWLPIVQLEPPFVPTSNVCELGTVAELILGIEPYRVGRGTPKQTERHLRLRPFTYATPRKGTVPVARSRNIARFRVSATSEFVRVGPWLAAVGKNLDVAFQRRVFVRQICYRDGSLVAALAPRGTVARYGVFTVVCSDISPAILCALLNSDSVAHYVRTRCAGYHKESFGRVTLADLRHLPVPTNLLKTAQSTRARGLRRRLEAAVSQAETALTANHNAAWRDAIKLINVLVDKAYCRGGFAAAEESRTCTSPRRRSLIDNSQS